MNRKEVQRNVMTAYNHIVEQRAGTGRSERLAGYEQAVRHRARYTSCGHLLMTTYGYEVAHWCRRSVCPVCASHWGRKLGREFVDACPGSTGDDYRMITLILGLATTPDGAFDVFRAFRARARNAIDYRRRSPSIDRIGWRSFGVAGALEIDHFRSEDYRVIGSDKQRQYRSMGYDPEQAHGSQWVATLHGIVHAGILGDGALQALFTGLAPITHFEDLKYDKALVANAEGILGYASKIGFETVLAHGEVIPWSPEAIADYVAASMRCSHGRQGYRLVVRPQGSARRRVQKAKHIDPMPIAVGP